MTNDPDQMRANIEATRGDLSRNVDALTESVRPGNVARRQKDKVNSAVSGAKDAVMGHAGSVQSTGSDALQATGDAISSAPNKVQQSAQGNPLAAGLIAVGVGWLVGSLLPASRPERQAAATLKDKAAPLAQQVSNVAKDTAQNLQQPAKEALEQVKSATSDAVGTVHAEASSTASDVADTARESARTIKDHPPS